MNRRRRHLAAEDGALSGVIDFALGSMGVFAFLFVAVATQMGAPDLTRGEIDGLKRERDEANARADAAEKGAASAASKAKDVFDGLVSQLVDAERTIKNQGEQIEDLKNRPDPQPVPPQRPAPEPRKSVRLVVVVDGSHSMAGVIDELRTCIDALVKVGTALFPRFELAVVCYRGSPVVMPLTVMGGIETGAFFTSESVWRSFAYENTERIGIRSVSDAPMGYTDPLPKFSSVGGNVRVDRALRQGLSMFPAAKEGTLDVLAIFADVGPYERDLPIDHVSAREAEDERALIAEVQAFARRANASVLALNTAPSNPRAHLKPQTRAFFKALAANGGTYSENASDVAGLLLRASLVQGDER